VLGKGGGSKVGTEVTTGMSTGVIVTVEGVSTNGSVDGSGCIDGKEAGRVDDVGVDDFIGSGSTLIGSGISGGGFLILAGALGVGCQPPMTGFASSFSSSFSTTGSGSGTGSTGAAMTCDVAKELGRTGKADSVLSSSSVPGPYILSSLFDQSRDLTSANNCSSCFSQSGITSLEGPEEVHCRNAGSKYLSLDPKSNTKPVSSGIIYLYLVFSMNNAMSSTYMRASLKKPTSASRVAYRNL